MEWLEKVSLLTSIENSKEIIKWNFDKIYL
jgi:hypothetical protein